MSQTPKEVPGRYVELRKYPTAELLQPRPGLQKGSGYPTLLHVVPQPTAQTHASTPLVTHPHPHPAPALDNDRGLALTHQTLAKLLPAGPAA